MTLSIAQCRGARGMPRMMQNELAEASSISARTIVEFEKGKRVPHNSTLKLLRLTLEDAGIAFIPDEGRGQGLPLRKK